jgi:flagellar biosynthetic protein FlhB
MDTGNPHPLCSGNGSEESSVKCSAGAGENLDLQRFAKDSPTGARTEDATDKRRRDAREKGQVAKSMDVVTAVVLLVGFYSMYVSWGYLLSELRGMMAYSFGEMAHLTLEPSRVLAISGFYMEFFARIAGPVAFATFIAALLANVAQVGILVTSEPIVPKLDRLNPLEGFKRLFSLRSVVELVKSVIKLVIIGYLPYKEIKSTFGDFYNMIPMNFNVVASGLGWQIFKIAMEIGAVLFILAIIDYAYQKWEFEDSLKMSKYDIRQERKEMEGDPKIKSEIRRRQMEMAFKRMMSAVPEADVVITNPTHYAVALKYDYGTGAGTAPEVVAKGKDLIARRIIELAQGSDVPVRRDPPLARRLYKLCEVGDSIPAELFPAVAEVLAFVYNLKGRQLS